MIEAYFTTSGGTIIPAIMPDEEIIELATMAGFSLEDLFSIDIPGGASRHTTIRAIVSQSQIATLYASNGTYGTASCTFSWRESTTATAKSIAVTLLPPKPLFMVPGHAGISVVEAVDVRYWWKRTITNDGILNQQFGPLMSSDGRWQTAGVSLGTTPLTVITGLRGNLPVGSFSTAGFTPDASLINRIVDHRFTPDMSIAMALDIALSAFGYVLVWNPAVAQTYSLAQIKDDTTIINSWMTSNLRAYAGGLEPTSDDTAFSETLLTAWNSTANTQVNRMPDQLSISFPYRTVEGMTEYNNESPGVLPSRLKFAQQSEFAIQQDFVTGRARKINSTASVLREPRPLVAPASIAFDPTTGTANTLNSPTPPAWNWTAFRTAVGDVLENRCQMSIGRVVWMGWPDLPVGAFRGTMLRYHLGKRTNKFVKDRATEEEVVTETQLVPITTTICDDDDWVLGSNGVAEHHPDQVFIGKGLAHARRLSSGVTTIDVAPPNCRIFPAIITGASRMAASGNGYWKWVYTFAEREPNPLANDPHSVSAAPFERNSTARNMIENPNIYLGAGNAGNLISPGVLQSHYLPNATIDCLPICNGAIVMMCEQYLTIYTESGSPPFGVEYWFSVPNAVKVTCVE
jgi:hypothetical protein